MKRGFLALAFCGAVLPGLTAGANAWAHDERHFAPQSATVMMTEMGMMTQSALISCAGRWLSGSGPRKNMRPPVSLNTRIMTENTKIMTDFTILIFATVRRNVTDGVGSSVPGANIMDMSIAGTGSAISKGI